MKTKVKQAIELYRNGDIKKALGLAKTFRIGLTKEERGQLARGYECIVHKAFYESIGRNPKEEIEKAKAIFEKRIYQPYVTAKGAVS
ncbi:hypothetical protein [Geobacillus stearothermophilus]|uniref:Uncharacterized protein n=1 Tax=Geobacillus stearothermophilus TaxID=1422 RepID=A0A150MVX9_GEOSE|nr:hypothetical protein [Geobacillus stearothermophilus]MED5073349.1 hypothetical protein [Anoxybacillus geothermalis]KYD28559.1 hypothetical protein B4109_3022 [Geobacillus stearothermophilus]MED3665303.1 hypothetical protein [Geobacillus stearothermophilus]MED3733909.1 hypothetical protein [Geobacillus stearothermophilus]MED3741453.1 hypothetical protein [Geobacillus stearothermophilus]